MDIYADKRGSNSNTGLNAPVLLLLQFLLAVQDSRAWIDSERH
jgi:hypothetical protein